LILSQFERWDILLDLDNSKICVLIGHYNLNPGCIYLDTNGRVRFTELGLAAHLFYDNFFRQEGFPIWNLSFLSPELATGKAEPHITSDMYSLACILYYMLGGIEPFQGAATVNDIDYPDFQLNKSSAYKAGPHLTSIFNRLSAQSPNQRYKSWGEVIKEFDTYMADEKLLKKNLRKSAAQRRSNFTRSIRQEELGELYDVDGRPVSDDYTLNAIRSNVKQAKRSAASTLHMNPEDIRKKVNEIRKQKSQTALSSQHFYGSGKKSNRGSKFKKDRSSSESMASLDIRKKAANARKREHSNNFLLIGIIIFSGSILDRG